MIFPNNPGDDFFDLRLALDQIASVAAVHAADGVLKKSRRTWNEQRSWPACH